MKKKSEADRTRCGGPIRKEVNSTVRKGLLNPKIHCVVLLITVLAELVGVRKVQIGPGVMLFLPMLYALVAAALLTLRPIRLFSREDSASASPLITLSIFFLIAKIAVVIGPNVKTIVQAGPALILQELGNLGTIFLALPIGIVLGLRRELIGATHSIAREPNLGLVSERYGLDGPEGIGVLGVYVMGTLFGAIFLGLFAGFLATATPLHPYALAMACGVGSGSMMAASSGTLVHLFPEMKDQIVAFAGASNLCSPGSGLYVSILVGLPLTEWLYKVLGGRKGGEENEA